MKGSIIKREGRKGISWLLKYDAGTDPKTGKRKVCYATVKGTRKEAEKELRNRLKAIDDNAHVDPTKLTTGQWLAKWLSDHAQPAVSTKTYQRYAELVAHATAHSDVASTPIQKLAAHQVQSSIRIYAPRVGGMAKARRTHYSPRAPKVAPSSCYGSETKPSSQKSNGWRGPAQACRFARARAR